MLLIPSIQFTYNQGRFKLFLFYSNSHQNTKTRQIGLEVLKMPVKIPSKAIAYYKFTVKKTVIKQTLSKN